MSAKIEELKAQQAAELERAIKTEADHEKIRAAFPNWDIKTIHPHFAYGQYGIELQPVDTLPDAIYIAEVSEPLAVFIVKDSCTTFIPEPSLGAYLAKHKNAKEECIGAYIYKIDGLRQYAQTQTLEFFVDVDGLICRVSVPVKHDPDTYRDYDITFDRRGNAHRNRCNLINKSGHFLHHVKWWTSEEHPNSYTLY